MNVATRLKPDPPAEPSGKFSPSREWLAAQEEWQPHRARMRELERERQQIRSCLSVEKIGYLQQERNARFIAELDPEVMQRVQRNPNRARRQAEDIDDQIAEMQPEYFKRAEEFQAAKNAEAARIALLFQPMHQQAVRKIALALQALNDALEEERTVHREYIRYSPEAGMSHILPDESVEFREMRTSVWGSRAATWLRRHRAAGTLK